MRNATHTIRRNLRHTRHPKMSSAGTLVHLSKKLGRIYFVKERTYQTWGILLGLSALCGLAIWFWNKK